MNDSEKEMSLQHRIPAAPARADEPTTTVQHPRYTDHEFVEGPCEECGEYKGATCHVVPPSASPEPVMIDRVAARKYADRVVAETRQSEIITTEDLRKTVRASPERPGAEPPVASCKFVMGPSGRCSKCDLYWSDRVHDTPKASSPERERAQDTPSYKIIRANGFIYLDGPSDTVSIHGSEDDPPSRMLQAFLWAESEVAALRARLEDVRGWLLTDRNVFDSFADSTDARVREGVKAHLKYLNDVIDKAFLAESRR